MTIQCSRLQCSSVKLAYQTKIARHFFFGAPAKPVNQPSYGQTYPNALFIDLLNNREFARFSADPHALTEQLKALSTKPSRIIIDEVQKIPALLDEVHLCIESLGLSFALCGSSARKVRRGHANLLGGRAVRSQSV